jgi:macrolide transport system ATP-binding/permease protein
VDSLLLFFRKLAILFRREKFGTEMEEEMAFHREQQENALLSDGVAPESAHYAAKRQFGNATQIKEQAHEVVSFRFETVLQDFRFALRQLRKNPGFTFTAIGMLALGICASVAIFAFVDAALIKPLPYRDPTRLVGVFESIPECPQCPLSYPDYLDWKRLNTVFTLLDVYQRNGFLLSTPEGAQTARGLRVSDGFLRTLGITPILGRDFNPGEDLASAQPTVLLSYAAWQQRYGGKEEVLGQTVILDGVQHTIIGVLPREFQFAPARSAEFWAALHSPNSCEVRRSCHGLMAIGRLKDGISIQTALADTKSIAAQLEIQYPDSNRGQGAAVAPLTEVIVGDIRPILLVLLGGAGLLLLIACVNVTSLLLVRSEGRRREIAVRGALGASSARLVRQFATEGLVLVAAGGAMGIILAGWLMRLLTRLIPTDMMANMSYLQDLGLNLRVGAFAFAIAIFCMALFSLVPTWRLSLSSIRGGLVEATRGSSGNSWRRLGSNLVVMEIAIAMVLLVGAGLLGKSLYRLLHVNLGFQPDHLATLAIDAPDAVYGKDEPSIALARRVIGEIEKLPGVQSVGISCLGIPMDGNGNTTWFRVIGRPWHGEHNDTPQRDVSPTYFSTLHAKLILGRPFNETDDTSKPNFAIVNQAFARKYFSSDEDAIGKQLSFVPVATKPIEIVGVVEDIKEGPLDIATPPVLYFPLNQNPSDSFTVVARTSQSEASLLPAMVAAIHQIDRNIAVHDEITMTERINTSQTAYLHHSSAWLVGGFAAMALLLSAIGLYGVVAYSVSQRTRELGIRLALGAQPRAVYQLVMKEAVLLAVGGIAIGLACAVAAATLMHSLLFGVRSWDVSTLTAVAVVLGGSALLASYVPARRAASLDPVDVLRSE